MIQMEALNITKFKDEVLKKEETQLKSMYSILIKYLFLLSRKKSYVQYFL